MSVIVRSQKKAGKNEVKIRVMKEEIPFFRENKIS